MAHDKRHKQPKIVGTFTPLVHRTMEAPAWIALSVLGKALYPLILTRCRRHGNGKANCSVRDAATYLGVNKDTAGKAFHELQAKGFIRPSSIGCLGVSGSGKASAWRVTELSWDGGRPATREFDGWSEGHDYEPLMGAAPPRKQKPVPPFRTARPVSSDVSASEAGA